MLVISRDAQGVSDGYDMEVQYWTDTLKEKQLVNFE